MHTFAYVFMLMYGEVYMDEQIDKQRELVDQLDIDLWDDNGKASQRFLKPPLWLSLLLVNLMEL
jgi:hypothetical protein